MKNNFIKVVSIVMAIIVFVLILFLARQLDARIKDGEPRSWIDENIDSDSGRESSYEGILTDEKDEKSSTMQEIVDDQDTPNLEIESEVFVEMEEESKAQIESNSSMLPQESEAEDDNLDKETEADVSEPNQESMPVVEESTRSEENWGDEDWDIR